MLNIESAYSQGVEAFMNGMKVTQIPYQKLSDDGISWLRGWHTAKYGQMMNENQSSLK